MESLIIESRLEQRLRNKILKFCYICGDEASSKHFGAMSCDACAAFFRRTISGKKSYRCLFKQDCALYNITPRRMCKFCRYQKCRQTGMNPDEVRSGSNTPASSPPPPPKVSSTPLATSTTTTSPIPMSLSLLSMPVLSPATSISSSSVAAVAATEAGPNFADASIFLKSFHRALVLENSVFVAAKNPLLLSSYLQPPHDSKLLEIALKNFEKVTEKFASFNNSFLLQYLETAGINLEAKMIEKIPKVYELINQSFQQYAELIKIRIRNEFEFAALCQLSLLKIASEEFPEFQTILTKNFEIVTQNFHEFYSNEIGENPSISLSNLSDLATTIHLIRKTYRNQITDFLRN